MMKVICTDNYDREGPGYDEKLVASGLSASWAERVKDGLNATRLDQEYFRVVPDDYVLRKFEP